MRYKAIILSGLIVLSPFFCSAAISFDSVAGASGAGSTLTGTNTAGDYMMLFISVNNLTDTPTCTWNGVSMTRSSEVGLDSTFYKNWAYSLANPDTGTHDAVCSGSSGITDMKFVTYSGVDPTNPEVSSHTDQGSGTSLTCSLSVVTDGSWLVSYALADQAGPLAAGAGSTLRGTVRSDSWGVFDSSGGKAPGSHSMSFTMANGASTCVIFALKPPSSGGSVSTASTTAATLSDIALELGVLITMGFLMVVGFVYNNMTRKKPWR